MKSKRKDSTARQPYEYNHAIPFLEKKLAKKGIYFPHPYGISATSYHQDA